MRMSRVAVCKTNLHLQHTRCNRSKDNGANIICHLKPVVLIGVLISFLAIPALYNVHFEFLTGKTPSIYSVPIHLYRISSLGFY